MNASFYHRNFILTLALILLGPTVFLLIFFMLMFKPLITIFRKIIIKFTNVSARYKVAAALPLLLLAAASGILAEIDRVHRLFLVITEWEG